MKIERLRGFALWLLAVLIGMALHAPIAGAVSTIYRNALIWGTGASSCAGALGKSCTGQNVTFLKSDGHWYAHHSSNDSESTLDVGAGGVCSVYGTPSTFPNPASAQGTIACDTTSHTMAFSDGQLWWEGASAVAPPISIASLSASSGVAGDVVTFTGAGFYEVSSVNFNGTSASFTVTDSAHLNATVPSGFTTGPVHVVNPVGTATGPTFSVPSLALDLTQASPSGLTSTRTGGTIYAARSTGTSVVAVTGADVYESRADGDGHWSFDTFTNAIGSAPTNFSTGWTNVNSATVTGSFGTGPDGTASASTQIKDTSATLAQSLFFNTAATGTTDAVASVWVKDSTPTPTATGAVYARGTVSSGGYSAAPGWGRDFTNVFGGATWKRVVNGYTLSATNVDPEAFIQPAGATNVRGGFSTQDVTQTGAVEVWGAQALNGSNDLPLVSGTTSALVQQVSPSLMSTVLNSNGDLDIEVGFIGNYLLPQNPTEQDGTIFSLATPLGKFVVTVTNNTTYNFKLGATTLQSATIGPNGGWPTLGGQEIIVRAWYRPSTNKQGLKVTFGGAYEAYAQTSSVLSAIGTPTSLYIGSDTGTASTFYARRYTKVIAGSLAASSLDSAEGVILGDSTSAAYSANVMTVGENVYTLAQSRTRLGIASLAVTGQRCDQQLTVWQASPLRGNANTKWVSNNCGINDILNGDSEITIVGRIQSIINDINTSTPGAKIILQPMIPVTLFTTGQKAIWTAVNKDIEGTGTITITGTGLIRMALWSALDDGSGNLLSQYAYGDNEHENDAGRQYIGSQLATTLTANSLLNGFPGLAALPMLAVGFVLRRRSLRLERGGRVLRDGRAHQRRRRPEKKRAA